ncbi:ATP-binding protein [Sphingomonas japonica]|uniref:histidine kinase n=1 Tax=Sphingomonas japonica TaxID=511662 RepID=A0ABX0TX35_9SPHN|nr:HAMP domain-containing sensor histidine kinase [Sphingomonas japonica]NIJ22850.1 signal transduction histidine kinase [Sphingomonas japonica]
MKRVHLWPSGLTGRVTLVLLAAILIEFLGTVIVFGESERLLLRNEQSQRIAEQLVVAERVIRSVPAGERPATAGNLSTRHVTFGWGGEPPQVEQANAKASGVASEIFLWEPELIKRELIIGTTRQHAGDEGDTHLAGALRLDDSSWLSFRSNEPLTPWATALETLMSVTVFALVVLVLAAALVRTLGAPLRALADAAGEIGFGHKVEVRASGPRELRTLADALNAMQARIRQLLDSRTQALTAVSHDLRTPLARLRLRLAAPPEQADVGAMRSDVEEMEAMLDSLLDFMRGGEAEAPKRTDIASLLQAIADDAADLGGDIVYVGPGHMPGMIRALTLRRAVTNLVDNARRHAGGAQIDLARHGDTIVITVRDEGPGMPAESLSHAAEAFFRGDDARQRDTKGLGLGLAIADQAARMHGGMLLLSNRKPHGLNAEIRFPATIDPTAASGHTL